MRVTADSIKLSKTELTLLRRAQELLGRIADVTDEDDAIYTKSANAECIISDLIADFHQF